MDVITAIIMGIIEGLTEFLPISSTGHMILTAHILGLSQKSEFVKTFEIIVQLGAVLAIFVLYSDKFRRLLSSFSFDKKNKGLNILHITWAILPATCSGLFFHDWIKQHLFGPKTVLYGLVVGAILMLFAEKCNKKTNNITAHQLDHISYKQAFVIGLFQCLALWPGFSRSGATISGGIFAKVHRSAAAEFTFIMSVPIMLGATMLDFIKTASTLDMNLLPLLGIGFATSFIVGWLAIQTFLSLLKKFGLGIFAYYRLVLAAIFFLFVL